MTIKDWQKSVDEWVNTHGVRYFDVKTNALLLSEEVGEFSRVIARSYGEQSFKVKKTNDEIQADIADELSDILFVVTCLANQMNIDLSEQLQKNIEKKTQRDRMRHKENTKLHK